MSTRTIEVEDTLKDRTESAIDEVRSTLMEYLEANPDTTECPCLNNDLDYSGTIHEIVDGSVPIYTSEINDTWYLYGSELEEAYENAGVGSNPRENDGMAAIYFYIMDKVAHWYDMYADGIFNDWREEQGKKETADNEEE